MVAPAAAFGLTLFFVPGVFDVLDGPGIVFLVAVLVVGEALRRHRESERKRNHGE
jgi:hypothetical protein